MLYYFVAPVQEEKSGILSRLSSAASAKASGYTNIVIWDIPKKRKFNIFQEKELALRGKIKSALTYPVIVLVFALGITYFLLTTIVPQFGNILTQLGGELPFITKMLLAISAFLQSWWGGGIMIVSIVGSILAYNAYMPVNSDVSHYKQ